MKIPETALRMYEDSWPDIVDEQYTHMVVPDVPGKPYEAGDKIWVLDLTDPDAEWYQTTVTED